MEVSAEEYWFESNFDSFCHELKCQFERKPVASSQDK